MGRNNNQYGKLWSDLFRSEKFCAKPLLDKVMFVLLITTAECDHAGLGRITARRWLQPLAPASEDEISAAMDRLEADGDIYFDRDTEEFFVREFMARDGIGAVPHTMVSAAKSAATVSSAKLAQVLLGALKSLDIHTPKAAKTAGQLDAALLAADEHCQALIDRLPATTPSPPELPPDPFPDGIGDPISDPIPDEISPAPESGADTSISDPIPDPIGDGPVVVDVVLLPSLTALPADSKRNHSRRPSHLRAVRELEHQSPDVDRGPDRSPPPAVPECGPRCRSLPCGRCADAAVERHHRAEQAAAERAAAAAAAAADYWTKVDDCGLCDHAGKLPTGQKCDHVDRTAIAARGTAKAWASLGGRKPAKIAQRARGTTRRRFNAPLAPLSATG